MLATLRVAHDLQMLSWLPREAGCGFTPPLSARARKSHVRLLCQFREEISWKPSLRTIRRHRRQVMLSSIWSSPCRGFLKHRSATRHPTRQPPNYRQKGADMNDVRLCQRTWRHAGPAGLHVRRPGFSWPAFLAGMICGFILTVLAYIAAKLAFTIVAVFGTGYLAGKYRRKR